MTDKAIVVVSGGLDSTTLLYEALAQGWDCTVVSFDYGQRHRKELHSARNTTDLLNLDHHIVNLRELFSFQFVDAGSWSSLISNTDVPEGHYAEDSMKQTIVPNRNMIMFSIAVGFAVSQFAKHVALGVHGGDHFIYPDCRPDFFAYAGAAAIMGNRGQLPGEFDVWLPYIEKDKNYIAQRAFDLNVPIENTWSCYKGGDIHCGKCGTCVERLEAIASTGNADPTAYADESFWKEAIANHG